PRRPYPQHHGRRSVITSAPTPQDLIERALATSTADHTIALARCRSSANLRWANNTLTTNGAMHDVQLTVISFAKKADGVSTGAVSGTAVVADQLDALVAAADAAAAAAAPAED